MNRMFLALGVFQLFLMPATFAHAGGQEGSGGDICEDRFKIVRDDLKDWIINGGSAGLTLPAGIGLGQYNSGMLGEIAKASISCTDDPVEVNGVQKTCKNWVDGAGAALILCNRRDFTGTADSDQYVLVHHELAGLAGFETNDSGDSQYPISNQLAGFLEDQVVKKLVVKQIAPSQDPFDPTSCQGPEITLAEAATFFQPGAAEVELGNYVIQKRTRSCTAITGCGSWGPVTTKIAPTLGALGLNAEMAGNVWLDVVGNDIRMKIGGPITNLYWGGAQCSMVASAQGCSGYDYNLGNQWVNGSVPTIEQVLKGDLKPLKLTGVLTDSCLRLTDSAKAPDHSEEQYVLLVRLR